MKAFPGCQIVAAKDGMVFFNKTFGYHTYEEKREVRQDDIYDLASITKIAATTLSVMKLSEENALDIDLPISNYLPFLRKSNKSRIIIREMMAHQSRLKPWIPYYQNTLKNSKPDESIYQPEIGEDFNVRVSEDLYISEKFRYVILDSIRKSDLNDEFSYRYSDLGFYLLKEAIENITNSPFDEWVQNQFYSPMGLKTTGFLPLKRFSSSRIPPTENDKILPEAGLKGDVHDQGAAMLGGISGHAGLFSDAADMAAILQMLLNGGVYGSHKYLDESTIKEFTSMQFPLNENRRGIGFDKPMILYEEDGPNCKSASPSSFGHSGFTGTYMWADPENGLIYVFLSNRVHPNAWNNKISELNIRTAIHQLLYDTIDNSDNIIQIDD